MEFKIDSMEAEHDFKEVLKPMNDLNKETATHEDGWRSNREGARKTMHAGVEKLDGNPTDSSSRVYSPGTLNERKNVQRKVPVEWGKEEDRV